MFEIYMDDVNTYDNDYDLFDISCESTLLISELDIALEGLGKDIIHLLDAGFTKLITFFKKAILTLKGIKTIEMPSLTHSAGVSLLKMFAFIQQKYGKLVWDIDKDYESIKINLDKATERIQEQKAFDVLMNSGNYDDRSPKIKVDATEYIKVLNVSLDTIVGCKELIFVNDASGSSHLVPACKALIKYEKLLVRIISKLLSYGRKSQKSDSVSGSSEAFIDYMYEGEAALEGSIGTKIIQNIQIGFNKLIEALQKLLNKFRSFGNIYVPTDIARDWGSVEQKYVDCFNSLISKRNVSEVDGDRVSQIIESIKNSQEYERFMTATRWGANKDCIVIPSKKIVDDLNKGIGWLTIHKNNQILNKTVNDDDEYVQRVRSNTSIIINFYRLMNGVNAKILTFKDSDLNYKNSSGGTNESFLDFDYNEFEIAEEGVIESLHQGIRIAIVKLVGIIQRLLTQFKRLKSTNIPIKYVDSFFKLKASLNEIQNSDMKMIDAFDMCVVENLEDSINEIQNSDIYQNFMTADKSDSTLLKNDYQEFSTHQFVKDLNGYLKGLEITKTLMIKREHENDEYLQRGLQAMLRYYNMCVGIMTKVLSFRKPLKDPKNITKIDGVSGSVSVS